MQVFKNQYVYVSGENVISDCEQGFLDYFCNLEVVFDKISENKDFGAAHLAPFGQLPFPKLFILCRKWTSLEKG